MLALQALTPTELASAVPDVTLPEARKLVAQVHRGERVHASSAVRRAAAEAVRAAGHVPELRVVEERASAIDSFVKYLVEAPDGARFESVRIPLEVPGRFTACVSSQVGCALACAFCATGRLGLTRNLEAWEIVEQVRVIRARLRGPDQVGLGGPDQVGLGGPDQVGLGGPDQVGLGGPDQVGLGGPDQVGLGGPDQVGSGRVHGVVFQGMGEPLANLDAVLAAIAVLTEPCAMGIDARAITVCTAGLPGGIVRLAREAPRVRLGLSIGSATETRRSLMPITRAHAFDEVLAAVAEHARLTGLAPMWAVTLLDGVNDGDDHARALAARARAFAEETGVMPRISVIAYNASDGDGFARSRREKEFRDALGMPSVRRYSGGSDIGAACGQLVGR